MTDLEQLPTLVLLLGKGAVLLIAAFLVHLAIRRGSAAVLHFWWRCALIALCAGSIAAIAPPLFPYAVTGERPQAEAMSASGVETLLASSDHPSPDVAPFSKASSGREPRLLTGLAGGLAVIWALGAGLVFCRWLVGFTRARRLLSESIEVSDPTWWELLRKCELECDTGVRSRLLAHPDLRCPVAVGVWRPSVIVPTDCLDLDASSRRMILLHELAHLCRRDALFHPLLSIVKALHWPNPLVWLASRSFRSSEERAVDDSVVSHGAEPTTYADLLMQFAITRRPGSRKPIPGVAAMAQTSTVERRIRKILNPTIKRNTPNTLMKATLATCIAATAIVIGSGTIKTSYAEDSPAPSPTKDTSQTPESLLNKIGSIVIPEIAFKSTPLEEAIGIIRNASVLNDPAKKGVNLVLRLSRPEAKTKPPSVTLNMRKVTVEEALDYVCKLTGLRYRVEAAAVVIHDKKASAPALFTKTYRISKELITESEQKNLSATDYLEAEGVTFPKGASAIFAADTQALVVRNTRPNLNRIDAVVAKHIRVGILGENAPKSLVQRKLDQIIIPEINLDEATLDDAIEDLRAKSSEFDLKEPDAKKRGINIVIRKHKRTNNPITLRLKNIPLREALRYVTKLSEVQMKVELWGVQIGKNLK